MPQPAEIALAKSAGPAKVSDHATIKVLTTSGFSVVHDLTVVSESIIGHSKIQSWNSDGRSSWLEGHGRGVRQMNLTPDRNSLRTSHRKGLLVVEDDDRRAAAIKACIPPDLPLCVDQVCRGGARRSQAGQILRDHVGFRSLSFGPRRPALNG